MNESERRFDDNDHEEWDEAKWEEFFAECDRREEENFQRMEQLRKEYGDRFGAELFFDELAERVQKSIDERKARGEWVPDFDELDLPDCDFTCRECTRKFECEYYEDLKVEETAESYGEGEIGPQERFRKIPAYHVAHKFAVDAHGFVVPYFERKGCPEELVHFFSNATQIAAKIAGATAYGFERDGLIANIAYTKRALRAAEECLTALRALRAEKALPEKELKRWVVRTEFVRRAVADWIEELRGRIWWRFT